MHAIKLLGAELLGPAEKPARTDEASFRPFSLLRTRNSGIYEGSNCETHFTGADPREAMFHFNLRKTGSKTTGKINFPLLRGFYYIYRQGVVHIKSVKYPEAARNTPGV